MTEEPMSCCPYGCPAFERMLNILSSEPYAGDLEEYRSRLEEDPEYLKHHYMSTALTLQFRLKLFDFPDLSIGDCLEGGSGECRVVDALKEAIKRGLPRDVAA